MSHYTVIVHLPGSIGRDEIDETLSAVLAPFDENIRVEPYRSYENGSAKEFWWVQALQRDVEEKAKGQTLEEVAAKLEAAKMPWEKFDADVKAKEVLAELDADVAYAIRLGDNPGWKEVAEAYNEKYGHGSALAVMGDDSDSEKLFYDEESGRAYTLTTYNPDSKWDWWCIGGRWQRYFVSSAKPGQPEAELLIYGSPGAFTTPESVHTPDGFIRPDGGPRHLLDFSRMRTDAGDKADVEFDQWLDFLATFDPVDIETARSWEHFVNLANAGFLTWDEARAQYNSQPLIIATKRSGSPYASLFSCPLMKFEGVTKEEYRARAEIAAVPGYALLTLDGTWCEPGKMGWFGVSHAEEGDREVYLRMANDYLDNVPSDDLLVLLDCHI